MIFQTSFCKTSVGQYETQTNDLVSLMVVFFNVNTKRQTCGFWLQFQWPKYDAKPEKKTAYLANFYDFPRLMKASIYDDMQLTSYFKMTIFVMINIVNNTCRKIRVF